MKSLADRCEAHAALFDHNAGDETAALLREAAAALRPSAAPLSTRQMELLEEASFAFDRSGTPGFLDALARRGMAVVAIPRSKAS